MSGKHGERRVPTAVAELVLVSVGFLFLIAPLITIWRYHIACHNLRAGQPLWTKAVTWTLWILLWAAIIAAAVSGAITSKAFDSDSARLAVKALRELSYVLSLGEFTRRPGDRKLTAAVVTFLVFVTIWSHFHFGLSQVKTLYLLLPVMCLLVVASYRVAQTFESNPASAGRSKAAFWVLQITFEL